MSGFSLRQAEYLALLAFLAFLPALEAPKNISLVFFLLFWGINRWRSGEWGGAWSGWETLAVVLVLSGFASTLFAGLPGKGLNAGNDVFAYALLFLALRRSDYEKPLIWRLLAVMMISTLLTLSYGYWSMWVTHEHRFLELHSVGHVNHSAFYVAIMFLLGMVWATVKTESMGARAVLWIVTAILFASLLLGYSRGAMIPAFVAVLGWFVLRAKQFGRRVWGSFALALLILGAGLAAQPGVLSKTASTVRDGQIGSYRPALARTAILAAREFPVFGVGMGNFNKISAPLTEEWQEKRGRWFEQDTLFFSSHAHGLYFNTLAERGLVGLLVLLAFLGSLGVVLFRHIPGARDSSLLWVSWGGGASAWLVMSLGGVFNTTLHHENAMLTLVLIALWMSQRAAPENIHSAAS